MTPPKNRRKTSASEKRSDAARSYVAQNKSSSSMSQSRRAMNGTPKGTKGSGTGGSGGKTKRI
jgi:hypothetical protein